jgi:hypothetical protein
MWKGRGVLVAATAIAASCAHGFCVPILLQAVQWCVTAAHKIHGNQVVDVEWHSHQSRKRGVHPVRPREAHGKDYLLEQHVGITNQSMFVGWFVQRRQQRGVGLKQAILLLSSGSSGMFGDRSTYGGYGGIEPGVIGRSKSDGGSSFILLLLLRNRSGCGTFSGSGGNGGMEVGVGSNSGGGGGRSFILLLLLHNSSGCGTFSGSGGGSTTCGKSGGMELGVGGSSSGGSNSFILLLLVRNSGSDFLLFLLANTGGFRTFSSSRSGMRSGNGGMEVGVGRNSGGGGGASFILLFLLCSSSGCGTFTGSGGGSSTCGKSGGLELGVGSNSAGGGVSGGRRFIPLVLRNNGATTGCRSRCCHPLCRRQQSRSGKGLQPILGLKVLEQRRTQIGCSVAVIVFLAKLLSCGSRRYGPQNNPAERGMIEDMEFTAGNIIRRYDA